MMKKALCFWFPLTLFIVLSCWWMTYFPYNRELLYRAIPVSSDIIIEQPDLYELWKDQTVQSVLNGSLQKAGVSDQVMDALNDGEALDAFMKTAASDNTLVARVPALTRGSLPAIVIATWAGKRGQFLNWGTGMLPESKVKHRLYEYGVDLWSVELPDDGKGYKYFSFSFFEGVLVGCLSSREFGIDYIVDRMIYTRPIAPVLQRRLKADDRSSGWFMTQNADIFGTQMMRYSFERSDDNGITGRLSWAEGNPFRVTTPAPAHSEDCREVVTMLGDAPGAILFASYQHLEWQMIKIDNKNKLFALRRMLREAVSPSSPIFISICAPDYGGRMRGFKVPSFLFGVKVKDPDLFMGKVSSYIDVINEGCKLNLIAVESGLNGHRVLSVDKVTGDFFEHMGAGEKPAVTMMGDWMIFSSNRDVLTRIISMSPDAKSVVSIDCDNAGALACWADFQALDAAFVNMIAMNDLLSIASGGKRETTGRVVMSTIQHLIRGIDGVESFSATTDNGSKASDVIIAVE